MRIIRHRDRYDLTCLPDAECNPFDLMQATGLTMAILKAEAATPPAHTSADTIDPRTLFNRLTIELGLKVTLTKTGRLSVKPKKLVTPEIAALIIANQAGLEAVLREEHGVTVREAGDTRPGFDVGEEDLKKAAADIWALIREVNEPTLFRHAGPARLEHDDEGQLVITPVDIPRLRHWLTQRVWFFEGTPFGPRAALPSGVLLAEITATPDPTLPVVTRVVRCPIFAPDGTLHEREGYDARTRAWLDLPVDFHLERVSSAPIAEEIAEARALILEPLCDFPFVGEADRAHAVAFVLTVLARDLIDGPTPLTLYTKPAPGTGATLCAKAAVLIPTGFSDPPVMTQAEDDAEWGKKILACLDGGPAVVLIDNLRGTIDSAALSAVLTTVMYKGRRLGRTEMVHVPNRAAWAATANNAMLSTELVRRSVRVKFDAGVEQPWRQERTFRHPDLLPWIRAHRADLVHAGLTLIAGWIKAGRPPGDATKPTFEDWSRVIGGVLSFAGIKGFLGNEDEMYEEQDVETDDVKRFLSAWWAAYGDTPKMPTELLTTATAPTVALPLGGKDEVGRAISLGMWLRKHRGRPYDLPPIGTVMITRKKSDSITAMWQLERREPAKRETWETSGDFHYSSRAGNVDLDGGRSETRNGGNGDGESLLKSPKSPAQREPGEDDPTTLGVDRKAGF
jgi:hypothetical protein